MLTTRFPNHPLDDFVRRHRLATPTGFAQECPGPFLIIGAGQPDSTDEGPSSFKTMENLGAGPTTGAKRVIDLNGARQATIGRTERNDITIRDGGISKLHAYLMQQLDGSYKVVDAKSTNGTWVNFTQLEPQVDQPLKGGDRIILGKRTGYVAEFHTAISLQALIAVMGRLLK